MSMVIPTQCPKDNTPAIVSPKLRLAIVGCGPRGLQCLETIGRRLSPEERANISVVIFEPAPHPGAGCVYDPAQPHELGMNFATQHIDFWKVSPNQTTSRSTSLLGWLATRYPELAKSDMYIPRAVVGEYLTDCLETVLRKFRPDQVEIIPQRVADLRPSASGWMVTSDDSTEWSVDQVVLTTGHEGLRESSILDQDDSHIFALPAQRQLTPNRIPPGSRVRINGFGLTAIDAVLSLTVGRGGSFENTTTILPKYHGVADQPQRIDIDSRSGRPMLAKPTAAVEPINDAFWDSYRATLNERMKSHGRLNFRRDIWKVMVDAASELLVSSDVPSSSEEVQSWFRNWSRYTMDATVARRVMIQSYAVAIGKRQIDIPYALAEAWRNLYPQMTRLIGFGGLAAGQWHRFTKVSVEMERIAFGPPAENVGRMLSLMKEGIVRLTPCRACERESSARASRPQFGERDARVTSQYDCIVNAVIAPPHQAKTGGPVEALIKGGWVELDGATGAVKVDASGHASGPADGLAVFGRATEGWIIGNDTLTRTLHPQMECWAEKLIRTMEAKC